MLLRRALPAARQSLAHPFPTYEMGSRVDDQFLLHDKIRYILAYQLAFVQNLVSLLLSEGNPAQTNSTHRQFS
jgi:hypothetical protein